MTDLNIYPDKIENFLVNVIPAVNAGVWKPYHAAIMDPPYYLGEIVDRFGSENAAPAKPGKDGSFSRLSRGFMGQTWDGFADVWDYQRWVYRLGCQLRQVLLPGALLFSFGGARTWDLVSTGLRLAGWEIYPQMMMWTYSTGSPVQYSLETAAKKALEKAKKELETVKTRQDVGIAPKNSEEIEQSAARVAEYERLCELYEGYRSDLKPAFEPIIVARNPSYGMTYLERAAMGTSAMNIDACRIPGPHWNRSTPHKNDIRGGNYVHSSTVMPFEPQCSHRDGRYPKNVVFCHHPECVPERGVCHTDCHVRVLDKQAPNQPAGGSHGMINKKSVRVYGDIGTSDWESYGDSGPASRFYYCPKANEWEKSAGLDDFPLEQHRTTISKATREKHGNDSGYPRANPHPTIKPLELTKWLCELIAPPKSIVEERRLLNPCSGVLSEALGAHLSGGWDTVDAIEQSREYCRIAEARWQWWQKFKTIEQAKSAYDGERKENRREADGQLRMF